MSTPTSTLKRAAPALVSTIALPVSLAIVLAGCRSPGTSPETMRAGRGQPAPTASLSQADFEGGTRWVYGLDLGAVPPPEIPAVARETLSIVRQRLEQQGVEKYRLRLDGDDRLVLEMPPLAAETGASVTRLIARRGRLVFRTESGDELEPRDLLRVAPITDAVGAPAVQLELGPDGATRLRELTAENIGKKLAIVVDDEVLSAPAIREPVGSSVQISGSFSEDEVARLVSLLRGGELPVELKLHAVGVVEEE